MASSVRGVWAVDIGSNSLKAIRLQNVGDGVEVIGFDYVQHKRIISAGKLDPEQKKAIIAESLRKFVERNDLGSDEVAISVAGHSSFARFIKLPPVP